MLKNILSISGKPGLYKLISQGRNMLLVESLTPEKKRFPAYSTDRIVSLGDISMYTTEEDVALSKVLTNMVEKENGELASIDPKKATNDELREYFATILPNFDRDRVYVTDIKKLISWYNILVSCGIKEFQEIKPE